MESRVADGLLTGGVDEGVPLGATEAVEFDETSSLESSHPSFTFGVILVG